MDAAPADTRPCGSCGATDRPTAFVSLSQTTGALFVRYEEHVNAYLCDYCLRFHFWRYTRHNLSRGWWGPLSAFLTIVWTGENVVAYVRAKATLEKARRRASSGFSN